MSRTRPQIESAAVLDLGALAKRGWLKPGQYQGPWPFSMEDLTVTGFVEATVAADGGTLIVWVPSLLATNDRQGQRIELVTVVPHLGGRAWLLLCPASGRRARKLHLFPGEKLFRHRAACRPIAAYRSQSMSPLDRATARRSAFERKLIELGMRAGKPKRMHWKRYLKLRAQYLSLDERESRLLMARLFPELPSS